LSGPPERYQTTILRACVAVPIGMLVGTAGALAVISFDTRNLPGQLEWGVVYLAVIYSTATALASAPLWFLLSRLKLNGWRFAAVLGCLSTAAICALSAFVSGGPRGVAQEFSTGLSWIASFALCGAIAGLAVWRVAYRKVQAATVSGSLG